MKKKVVWVVNKDGSLYPKKLNFLGSFIKLDIDASSHWWWNRQKKFWNKRK